MRSSRHAPDVASLRGSKYSPEGKGIDPTGAAVLPLIEADPYRDKAPDRPLLGDGDWVALQGICSG